MINVTNLMKPATQFINTNAPAILTAFGAAGVVGTAVLTARASFKSAKDIFDENRERMLVDGDNAEYLTRTEEFKLVWLNYLPAATSGILSVSAIVFSHRISSRRAAVLAAAYALNQDKLEEYQEKVKEKFGEKKAKEVDSELHQDHINRITDAGFLWADPTAGKVWIVEAYTGRPFLSSIELVNKAVNEVNSECVREGYIRMTEFYETVGLRGTSHSDGFGWNRHEMLELSWDTATSPDGSIPVHVFEYVNEPVLNPGDGTFR